MTRTKNWLEWTVFALGLVLVGAVLGYLTYDALTRGSRAPDLHVLVGEPLPRGGRWLVPVLVTNHGDRTAEDVHLEVRLHRRDGEVETAPLEFPFVPRQARRRGWASFAADPAQGGRLESVVLGYREE